MLGVQPPCWEVSPAALVSGEGFWVFLKDIYAVPPVLSVKLQLQSIPHLGGPWVTRKLTGALPCRPRKDHIVDLWVVFHMTDQKPVPVYWWLCTVHTAVVCHHGARSDPNSAFQSRDPLLDPHLIWILIPVHFKALASAEIPNLSTLGWHIIKRDLETLTTTKYLRKRPTSMLCRIQSGYLDITMPSSE